jgi:hypothetical protein
MEKKCTKCHCVAKWSAVGCAGAYAYACHEHLVEVLYSLPRGMLGVQSLGEKEVKENNEGL